MDLTWLWWTLIVLFALVAYFGICMFPIAGGVPWMYVVSIGCVALGIFVIFLSAHMMALEAKKSRMY